MNAAALADKPRLIQVRVCTFLIIMLTLPQEINNGNYQVVVTSPENALSSSHLKPYLTQQSKGFSLIIIVDEAHLIKKWGESKFRKAWAEIGLLRAFVLPETVFAAFSATLTSEAIDTVKKSLHMHPHNTLIIKIGNFRPNIIWDVKHISGTGSAIHEIAHYLPSISPSTTRIPLTIIFVNERDQAHSVHAFLKNHVPLALRNQIQPFHAIRSQRSKDKILDFVHTQKHGILVCTEAAAMV